jgi:hypothetical protein
MQYSIMQRCIKINRRRGRIAINLTEIRPPYYNSPVAKVKRPTLVGHLFSCSSVL